jgi:hypothetical protein
MALFEVGLAADESGLNSFAAAHAGTPGQSRLV